MAGFFRNLIQTILSPTSREAASLESLSWLIDQGQDALRCAAGAYPGCPPLAGALRAGRPWAEALPAAGLLEPREGELLVPFEEAGRLPSGLRALATLAQERHEAIRGILGRSAYPLLVLHMAAVAIHIPGLMTPNPSLAGVLGVMALTLILVDALLLGLAWRAARAWRRGTLEDWPLVGGWFQTLERSRALLVLEICHGAGIHWDRALDLTAAALTSPTLRRRLAAARLTIDRTGEPGAVLQATLELPSFCRGFLESGQLGGELEKGLRESREAMDKLARQRRSALIRGVGAGLYVLAVLAVLAVTLRVFSVYLDLLRKV